MRSAFSFQGELSQAAYATAAAAVFFSQYAIVWGVLALSGEHAAPAWWFWFSPLRALVFADNAWFGVQPPLDDSILLLGMGLYIIIDWLLVALSFRRARQAGVGLMWPALAVIPILQAFLIVGLSLAPAKQDRRSADA